MNRSLVVPLASLLILGALGTAASADVDVFVQNGDAVRGSVPQADSVDSYRILCPAGAKLKVKVKGKKGMRPSIEILDPLVPGPKKGAMIETRDALPRSGVYIVRVSGEAGSTGDYSFSASFKTPKKVAPTVTLAVDESSVPFSVAGGTVLKVKAKAVKGSTAVPRILRVEGPDGYLLDLSGPGKAASDVLAKTVLPNDGDYVLVVGDTGGLGGDASVSLSLKQPKPAKRKLDLRDRAIGNTSGERFAVSDVVDDEGGLVGVALPADGGPDSVIAGSSVLLPVGAVTSPTPIVIATTTDVKPKGDDAGAGPSVFFGPEGLSFAEDVSVTIPLDLSAFDGDFSTLRVYTRDARGRVRLVEDDYDVDPESGTCTFQVSHFSSFRAARAGGGGGGDITEFLGAWRELTVDQPTDTFLVFKADGTVDIIGELGDDLGCVRQTLFLAGFPVDEVFEIVDGRLRFIDDPDQEDLQFERASPGDVPVDCNEI